MSLNIIKKYFYHFKSVLRELERTHADFFKSMSVEILSINSMDSRGFTQKEADACSTGFRKLSLKYFSHLCKETNG